MLFITACGQIGNPQGRCEIASESKTQYPCSVEVADRLGVRWVVGARVYTQHVISEAWARAFSAVALARAPAPGAAQDDDDSDTGAEGLSFAAQTGRRMLRGRRRMAFEHFRRNLALSLIMLSPLHWLMAALFKASEQQVDERRVSDIVESVNMGSARCIDLMRADVEDRLSKWGLARNTTRGTPLPDIVYMRREMMRTLGGFQVRLVAPLTFDDMVQ